MGAHRRRILSRPITGVSRFRMSRFAWFRRTGRGVRGGKTFGERDGGRITIHVGRETTMDGSELRLDADTRNGASLRSLRWRTITTGSRRESATYVEPIARVRAKHMDAHEMWFELVRDLHQGLPATPAMKGSTTLTPGAERTGAARFSAFSRTSKFTSRRITAKASTTRCAEF